MTLRPPYALFAEADLGVRAARGWLRQSNYLGMWQSRLAGVSQMLKRRNTAPVEDGQDSTQDGLSSAQETSNAGAMQASASKMSQSDVSVDSTRNPVVSESKDWALETLLDRQRRHVQHCAICQKAHAKLTSIIKRLELASAFLAVAAVAATTMLVSGPPPVLATVPVSAAVYKSAPLACAIAAFALFYAKKSLEQFCEQRFVNGIRAWRRKGGLSLVSAHN